MKHPVKCSLLAAASLFAYPTALLAQTADATTATAEDPIAGEIVVTAQRRATRLMDVPVSTTVVSAQTLASTGVTSTRDLERVTPSLQMQSYGGWVQPAIRGISSKGASPGDSSNVAVYIDGVYQPNQAAQLFDLPDVDRVEVLKGPQGSLYGQNAAGGAIIITTREPNATPAGRLYAGYGNYDDVTVGGFASGPLTDTLFGSLSGHFEDHDGYRRNIALGGRDFGLRSYLARAKLRYEPNDDVKLTLAGMYSRRKDSGLFAGIPLNGNSIGYLFHPELQRPSARETATSEAFSQFTTWQVSLRGEFRVGPGDLSTVTAYNRVSLNQHADADYTEVNFAVSSPDPKQRTFIQEVNYVADKVGRFSWLGGVFYMHTEDGYPRNSGGFSLYSGSVAPAPAGAPTFDSPFIGSLVKDSAAAYLEATYDILDNLTLTAGGRYSYERQRGYAASSVDGSRPPEVEFAGGPQTFKKFTPRLSLVYRPTNDTSIFATYSRGFKSGLINVLGINGPAVKPENVTGYEIGFRARKPGLAFFEASVYRYDYKDLQVSAYIAPDYIYENAAAARIKGAEASLELTPIENLTLTAAGAYMDAKYVRYQGRNVLLTVFTPNATNTGNDQIALDVTGGRVERAPKFTANLSARYVVPTAAGDLSLFGSLYHNSGFALEPSGRVRQGAYDSVDAEISFTPAFREGLKVSLWGRNLGDRNYLQSSLITAFADGVSYAPPRTYGVRLEYSY